eukprot:6040070-Heterocapsa_arctica.AAC.1
MPVLLFPSVHEAAAAGIPVRLSVLRLNLPCQSVLVVPSVLCRPCTACAAVHSGCLLAILVSSSGCLLWVRPLCMSSVCPATS